MPRGDGTGPQGQGPMTGHAGGYCAGYAVPGFMNPVTGRGFGGRGRGRGRHGRRNMFHATGLTGWQRAAMGWPGCGPLPYDPPVLSKERQLELLNGQREHLEGVIEEVKNQIETLEANVES